MRVLAAGLVVVATLALAPTAHAADTPLATQENVVEARGVLEQWIAAYQAEDYRAQWRLTDPRIRRWWDQRRWQKGMTRARRRDGSLASYEIVAADPIAAEKLPCTELGHCYRQGVQYVVFIIRSAYQKAKPGQPEYAAMAKSDEGWRFGGGTFPNRPLGETAVIMTESDERRYKPDLSGVN